MRTLRPLLATLAVLCAAPVARADELLPADRPVETAIDHYIGALLKLDEITPAPRADDATLVRRLTLDLVGRIPTVAEADGYVKSADPAKQAKLVDRLIASPGFVRFQAAQFDAMLTGPAGNDRRRVGVGDYLAAALKDGKSWDRVFRELILPDDSDPKQKGAAEYLRGRVNDLDKVTVDVSVAFFGVNVSCAQCHDHPHVADWKQDHFYGMKSFFARTYEAGGKVAERPAGLVKFKPTRGPERSAKLMFLTGATVETDTVRELTKDEMKESGGKGNKSAKPPPRSQSSVPGPSWSNSRCGPASRSTSPGRSPTGCGTGSSGTGWSTRSTRCTPRTRRRTPNCWRGWPATRRPTGTTSAGWSAAS